MAARREVDDGKASVAKSNFAPRASMDFAATVIGSAMSQMCERPIQVGTHAGSTGGTPVASYPTHEQGEVNIVLSIGAA
jgi:hypothetical protein